MGIRVTRAAVVCVIIMNVLKGLNNMKARKVYNNGKVFVHIEVEEGYLIGIAFENEQQMRRAGQCLIDLARIGGNEVEIKDIKTK